MKKLNWLFLTILPLLFFSCEDEESLDSTPPVVEITSPTAGAIFSTGDELIITGTVTDNVVIEQIVVSIDGPTNFNDITLNPGGQTYSMNQVFEVTESFTPGGYTVTVTATDSEGNEDSASVGIVVEETAEPEPQEPEVSISGIEEGQTFDALGRHIPFTLNVADPEGVDSVSLNLQTLEGLVSVADLGFGQEYFTLHDLDPTNFIIEDSLAIPNVEAVRGEQTLTITTYRNATPIGTTTVNLTAEPQEQAQAITFNVTPPETTPEDAEVVLVGDFQLPEANRSDNVLYRLTDEDEDGVYSITVFINEDISYNYALLTEEGVEEDNLIFMERDAACEEVNRSVSLDTEETTINDVVENWNNIGPCEGEEDTGA